MTVNSLIEAGLNFKVEMSIQDLQMFAESVIERYITRQGQMVTEAPKAEPVEESYLGTKEVKARLHVCDTTLNQWAKRGYLVPIKVGHRNMYPLSEIKRVETGQKRATVANYCKKGGKA